MIIGPVVMNEVGDGQMRRSSVVQWAGSEMEIELTGPTSVLDHSLDASAFVCACLPVAMRAGERVKVHDPVSPLLLERMETLQAVYRAWDPTMVTIAVDADASDTASTFLDGVTAGRRSGAFFSRGVDSLFTAARDRSGTRSLDALVMVDRLEPRHDDQVRREEIRRAGVLADLLELPLVVPHTNVRDFMDRAGFDWEDALGAGLSFVALNMAGDGHDAFSAMTIPSSDSYETVEPCGSSPLLDPNFSTERLAVHHGTLTHTRLTKLRWLRENHPELLAHLKVCYADNTPDNCGRCGKCLYTMACLRVVDASELALEFPTDIDLDRIRGFRLPHLKARLDWAELATAITTGGEFDGLRDAALTALRRSVLNGPTVDTAVGPAWSSLQWVRNHRLNATLSLVIDGVPYPGGGQVPSER